MVRNKRQVALFVLVVAGCSLIGNRIGLLLGTVSAENRVPSNQQTEERQKSGPSQKAATLQPGSNDVRTGTDQTVEEIVRNEKLKNEPDGTGVFLVAAPDLGEGRARRILVKNIDYQETKKRGKYCLAFKWYPASFLPYDKLESRDCFGRCPSPDCIAGCTCWSGLCW